MSEEKWKEDLKKEKQERRNQFKSLTLKQKAVYIWDYYKLIIIGSLIGFVIVGNIIYTIAKPEPAYAMNLVMVNTSMIMEEEHKVFTDYEKATGLTETGEKISINSNIRLSGDMQSQTDFANYQLLSVLLMTNEIDLMLSDETIFKTMAASGGFYEISDILSEDILKKYEDYIVSVTDEETKKTYACGIKLPEDTILIQEEIYTTSPVAGILSGTENKEEAIKLLLYLLGEKI